MINTNKKSNFNSILHFQGGHVKFPGILFDPLDFCMMKSHFKFSKRSILSHLHSNTFDILNVLEILFCTIKYSQN